MSGRLHRLANGLTIAVDPIAGAQSTSVGLYAGVGSRSEPEGKGGLAHLVEHMVFKGAGPRDARGIAEAIEDVGGTLNAWTARDQTAFHARILPGDLALAMELIADLVRAPKFDAVELEREKSVVLSELGECLDTPDDLIGDRLFEVAFAGQPIGRSVLGNEASVKSVIRDDLIGWIAREYAPSRLVLAASGNVDEDALLALAEAAFGDMAGSEITLPAPAQFTGGQHDDRRSFEQAHWIFALPGLPASDPGIPALSIFTQAVGGGMSSRLFQQLREDRGLAYSIYAWGQGFADAGLFAVGCASDRDRAGETLKLAREIVARTTEDLNEAEVKRARAQLEAGLLMALETPQGRADHLARSVEVFGRIIPVEETLAQLRAVDAQAARSAGTALHAGPIAIATIGAAKAPAGLAAA
jgi:predicted Zn-dependent peptidase